MGPKSSGEPASLKVRIGENVRDVKGRKVVLAGGSAVVLAGDGLPILLDWQRGDKSLHLDLQARSSKARRTTPRLACP